MDDLGVLYSILGNLHLHHVGKCWHTPAALSFWRGQHRPVALDISFLAWWKHIGAPSTTCDIWHASTTWQVLSLGPKGVCKTSMQLAHVLSLEETEADQIYLPSPQPWSCFAQLLGSCVWTLQTMEFSWLYHCTKIRDPLHQGGGRFTDTGAKAT